jgi:hypothetical protein
MGAAYSQANTNTSIGSSQGSGMRTNLSNTPPDVFQNFVAATAGLSDVGFGFFTAVVPAPANLDTTGRVFFHFSNARVWRSNNGGLNWILIGNAAVAPSSPGLPLTRRFRSSPYNLGVSLSDLNRIVVGAAGGFIDITTNGGATWTDLDLITRAPGYQGFVTNVIWQDNQHIWVSAVAQAPGALRVLKGSIANPGDSWLTSTWTAKQTGLPDLPITRLYFDPRDPARNTIFAATHVGIYRTTDGGDNWQPYGNGLPTVRVNDIYMPPDGSFTRIATYGRGIWELSQLELVNTQLTDDVASCDSDGVLDNGETGRLSITLKNQGPNNVNQVTLTVTSSNPNVTFPDGNVIAFPPVQKDGEGTGSIRVALNGAAGIETTNFQIAVSSPELGLPGPLYVGSEHRLNYDEQPQGSATETLEGATSGWSINGDLVALPNVDAWQRRSLSPVSHVWWGPDNNGQTDGQKASLPDEQILTSPVMNVGSAPLVITFSHRFAFESGNWDGGVIELSNNGGSTWTDIGVGSYNGSTNGVTSAPIGANRPAFVNRMVGWPNFATVTRNLGTTYAGQSIMIRFRIGADESTGAPGWDIDNVTVSGLTNTPFTGLVPEPTVCTH